MSVLRIYVKYCCIMVMLNQHQEMAVVITHFERIGTIQSRCRNMGRMKRIYVVIVRKVIEQEEALK